MKEQLDPPGTQRLLGTLFVPQCPQCEPGWLQYYIATDSWNCPKCRYECGAAVGGGPTLQRQEQADAHTTAA